MPIVKEIDNKTYRSQKGDDKVEVTQTISAYFQSKDGDYIGIEYLMYKGNFDLTKDGYRMAGSFKIKEDMDTGLSKWDIKCRSFTRWGTKFPKGTDTGDKLSIWCLDRIHEIQFNNKLSELDWSSTFSGF